MVALNVQCSMFNGESSLKFPAWRVVATAAVVVAASAGCFGFLGHDVGCNVLHFLSLLIQGKLLREGLARRPEGESQLDTDGCAQRPRKQVGRQHVLGGYLSAPVLGFAFLCRDSA